MMFIDTNTYYTKLEVKVIEATKQYYRTVFNDFSRMIESRNDIDCVNKMNNVKDVILKIKLYYVDESKRCKDLDIKSDASASFDSVDNIRYLAKSTEKHLHNVIRTELVVPLINDLLRNGKTNTLKNVLFPFNKTNNFLLDLSFKVMFLFLDKFPNELIAAYEFCEIFDKTNEFISLCEERIREVVQKLYAEYIQNSTSVFKRTLKDDTQVKVMKRILNYIQRVIISISIISKIEINVFINIIKKILHRTIICSMNPEKFIVNFVECIDEKLNECHENDFRYLPEIICCLVSISTKSDYFEKTYRKYLSRRMIHPSEHAINREKDIVAKLKTTIGETFVKNFETILQEVNYSLSIYNDYKKLKKSSGTNLSVQIVSSQNWKLPPPLNVNIPPEVCYFF